MPSVQLVNKSTFDQTIGEINDRLELVGAPVDASGLATLDQVTQLVSTATNSAAADATTKANAAQAAAATDATSKANAAQTAAATNAASQVATHNADSGAHATLLSSYATKAYVDSSIGGVSSYPQACDVATTGNITLSGLQTIDTVSVTAGMRVLVWQQTDPVQNGIYTAGASTWARASDFDSDTEILKGALVFVSGGSDSGNKGVAFILDTNEPQVPGSTPLVFRQYARPDQVAVSSPLLRTGNTISLPDGTLTAAKFASANIDGAAGTPSLRTLGTSSGQALPGNHASVTNARTPTAHATSHQVGGTDALNPASLGITGAHVAFTPVTGVSATNIQNAIAQVQANVAAIGGGTGTFAVSSNASSISASYGQALDVDASGGAVQITLPAASNNQRPVIVRKIDDSSNPVTIVPLTGSINGSPSMQLTTKWSSRIFLASGTAWGIYGSYEPPELYARLDQDIDFQGRAIYNYRGTTKTITGSTYTLDVTDLAKTLLFTNTASTKTITLPAGFTPEWWCSLRDVNTATPGAKFQFVNAGSATIINADSVTAGASKRYALVQVSVESNTSGSNAQWALDGYTA